MFEIQMSFMDWVGCVVLGIMLLWFQIWKNRIDLALLERGYERWKKQVTK